MSTLPARVRRRDPSRFENDGWRRVMLGLAATAVFVLSAWLVSRAKPVAPQLPLIAIQTLNEGQSLKLNLAPADLPQRRGQLEFRLIGRPLRGVVLDRQTGILQWTPEEAQGPGTYPLGVRASVAGSPHLFDEATFEVAVVEVHQPPQIEPIELHPPPRPSQISTIVRAHDHDQPAGKLLYSVKVTPAPANQPSMNDSGQFFWQPQADDLGRQYQLVFRVAKAAAPEVFSEQEVELRLPLTAAVVDEPENPAQLPPSPKGDEADLDRIVTETVRRVPRCHVVVRVGTRTITAYASTPIPAEPFQLETVVLAGPAVTNELMQHLAHLKYLKSLDLKTGTQVTDAGTEVIAGLTTLNTLNVETELLTDAALVHVARLHALEFLNLANGRYTDTGIRHLSGLTRLMRLALRNCQCTDASFADLARLSTLNTLTVGSEQVTGEGLSHLAGLEHLHTLGLECPSLTHEPLGELVRCQELRSLSLRGSFGDPAWEAIGQLTHLRSLVLDSPRLTCALVEHLAELKALQTLTLQSSGPVVIDDALAVIGSLPQLDSLTIQRGEAVTDKGLAHFSGATLLRAFTLQQAGQITDGGLKPLAELPNLKHLQLHDAAKITDAALKAFHDSKQLETFHFGGSQVTPEGLKALREAISKRGKP